MFISLLTTDFYDNVHGVTDEKPIVYSLTCQTTPWG